MAEVPEPNRIKDPAFLIQLAYQCRQAELPLTCFLTSLSLTLPSLRNRVAPSPFLIGPSCCIPEMNPQGSWDIVRD